MADVEFELTYSFAATLIGSKEFLALERPVDGPIIAAQLHSRRESLVIPGSMGLETGFARHRWRKALPVLELSDRVTDKMCMANAEGGHTGSYIMMVPEDLMKSNRLKALAVVRAV